MSRLAIAALVAGISLSAVAQDQPSSSPAAAPEARSQSTPASADQIVLPAGTKLLLALKSGINTKTARVGDGVYLECAFPLVHEGRMIIPAGTYVQGRITSLKRPGRVKGRAELLMHFTTMIFPNGVAVSLPGAVDSVPGAGSHRVADDEGTVQQEGQKGRDVGTIATATVGGAAVGASGAGARGAAVGGLAGAALGTAITLFSRGSDVIIEPGTTVEMILQRPLTLERSQLAGVPGQYAPVDRQSRILNPTSSRPVDPNYRDLDRPVLTPPIPR